MGNKAGQFPFPIGSTSLPCNIPGDSHHDVAPTEFLVLDQGSLSYGRHKTLPAVSFDGPRIPLAQLQKVTCRGFLVRSRGRVNPLGVSLPSTVQGHPDRQTNGDVTPGPKARSL